MSRDTLVQIVAVLGVLFVLTLIQHIRSSILRHRGRRAIGTCVRHIPPDRDGKVGVLVEFYTEEGQRVRENFGYTRYPMLIGQQAAVVYDRRRPARAEFSKDVSPSPRKIRIFLAVVLFLMLVLGAVILFAY